MPDYRFRSTRPDGLVMHELGTTSASLAEAQAYACQLARSLITASPEGKSWGGWCVEVIDTSGRLLLRVPFSMVSGETRHVREREPERPIVLVGAGYSRPRHIGPRPWRIGP